MRDISLEVPLCPFALAWRGQRDDTTNPRIETLRDALDDAALASCVASFENDNNLQLLVDDPVLQLDQLPLQAKQFLEIKTPIDSLFSFMLGEQLGTRRHRRRARNGARRQEERILSQAAVVATNCTSGTSPLARIRS